METLPVGVPLAEETLTVAETGAAVSDRGRRERERRGSGGEGGVGPVVDEVGGVDAAEAGGKIVAGRALPSGENAVAFSRRWCTVQLGLDLRHGMAMVPVVTSLKTQPADRVPVAGLQETPDLACWLARL